MNTKTLLKKIMIFSLLALFCFSSCSYQSDQDLLKDYDSSVMEMYNEGTTVVVRPKIVESDEGLIFYPGALVSYESYLPLLLKCANPNCGKDRNITCFLVQMPEDMAMYNVNAADMFIGNHPEIKKWYIAGHSLGGAMASNYAASNSSKLEGLILLAAYSTADLKNTNLKVLSIYGSEDGVLNRENYKKYKPNLPEDFEEVVIDGANHAGFGSYGEQKGDKEHKKDMPPEDQKEKTAREICRFIKGKNQDGDASFEFEF